MQECGVGLVTIRQDGTRYAFDAPPLLRSGPVDRDTRDRVVGALGLTAAQVSDVAWIDNGPGWIGVLVDAADTVLDLTPDFSADRDLNVGVLGPVPGRRSGRL